MRQRGREHVVGWLPTRESAETVAGAMALAQHFVEAAWIVDKNPKS